MIDVLIYGINGKMGKEVYNCATEQRNVNIVCGVDKHGFGDFNCPVYTSLSEVSYHVDAIIDFSHPSSLDDILRFAKSYGCTLVLATTGYSEHQLEQIRECSKHLPICLTSNTATGISAMLKAVRAISDYLSGFEVSLVEAHRKDKKDAPSGTALAIKNALPQNVQTHSIRCGDVVGSHELTFYGEGEQLTIRHVALSRRVFAKGAIDACLSTAKKGCGLYGADGVAL